MYVLYREARYHDAGVVCGGTGEDFSEVPGSRSVGNDGIYAVVEEWKRRYDFTDGEIFGVAWTGAPAGVQPGFRLFKAEHVIGVVDTAVEEFRPRRAQEEEETTQAEAAEEL